MLLLALNRTTLHNLHHFKCIYNSSVQCIHMSEVKGILAQGPRGRSLTLSFSLLQPTFSGVNVSPVTGTADDSAHFRHSYVKYGECPYFIYYLFYGVGEYALLGCILLEDLLGYLTVLSVPFWLNSLVLALRTRNKLRLRWSKFNALTVSPSTATLSGSTLVSSLTF